MTTLKDMVTSTGMFEFKGHNSYVLACFECFFDDIQGFLEKLSSYVISYEQHPTWCGRNFALIFTLKGYEFLVIFPKNKKIMGMVWKHRKDLVKFFKPGGGYLFTDEYWSDIHKYIKGGKNDR
jgi:hypothetical protein